MSKQGLLVGGLVLVLVAAAAWYLRGGDDVAQQDELVTTVTRGPFAIYALATGELKAKNSVKVQGPQGMRSAGIYQTNITDLVTEGTVVEEGGYVAQLDRTELETKMREAQTEIDLIETQLEQAKIDTAIELRGLRDELVNSRFAREERTLEVDQSRYEPQMVIRKAEIELERSDRDFGQLQKKYTLSQVKAEAKIAEILAKLKQQTDKLARLGALSGEFMIKAPAAGMVIYARNWNGKITTGSQVSAWNPTVAELPDLTEMLSKTYVNEVDIARVRVGQDVAIGVDAFPDKTYAGTVVAVANIGESLKGYDAKVFEVKVALTTNDSILRPAMTTSNEILTYVHEDVLSVPIEALQRDSVTYVITDDNGTRQRQEVVVGDLNDAAAVIALGVSEGQSVLLSLPEDASQLPLKPLDPVARERALETLKQQRAARDAVAQVKAAEAAALAPGTNSGGSSGGVIVF